MVEFVEFTEAEARFQSAVCAVDSAWGASYFSAEQRNMLAFETVSEFNEFIKTNKELTYRERSQIIKRVKEKVVGFFGLTFLLSIVVGWIAGKILDMLWDNWKSENVT